MTEEVTLETRDGVAWITLNRPDKHNSINRAVREQLPILIEKADLDPEIRTIVVLGAGEKSFCAGADIGEIGTDPPAAYHRSRSGHHWISAFDRCRTPIIAAIHGNCLGGGLEIALACDIRIASENAVFALPETRLGVFPAAGGTQRLRALLGMGRALDMVLTNRQITAAEALEIGLVTRVVPIGTHLTEANLIASHIAGNSPLATELAKEAMKRGATLSIADGIKLEVDLISVLLATEDRKEATAAYREKRKPVFSRK